MNRFVWPAAFTFGGFQQLHCTPLTLFIYLSKPIKTPQRTVDAFEAAHSGDYGGHGCAGGTTSSWRGFAAEMEAGQPQADVLLIAEYGPRLRELAQEASWPLNRSPEAAAMMLRSTARMAITQFDLNLITTAHSATTPEPTRCPHLGADLAKPGRWQIWGHAFRRSIFRVAASFI